MIKHECDNCLEEPKECYCQDHLADLLEQERKEGYDEGYQEGKQESDEKTT